MPNPECEPSPYPYTIPPATSRNPATIKNLDPWHVQEFFRIELLLRSRTVMSMYHPEGTALQSPGNLKLMLRYGFGWYVLQGALEHGANGFGDAVGKCFSRLVTSVGLTDPGLVLHSLRHGGITKLHAAGVPLNHVEVLAGHSSNTVHGQVYVHRDKLPLSLLREGLERLTYPDVVKALR